MADSGFESGADTGSGAADEVIRRCLSVLTERGETMASCESLTGGLVGGAVTAVPGASAVYRGGLITYATELKAELAGVDRATLDRHGAVSAQTARQLARGAARVCGADWGLATTGVAGPDRQEGRPPGTVFVAVVGPARPSRPGADAADDESDVEQLALSGDRGEIRQLTVLAVFRLLEQRLVGRSGGPSRS